LSAGPSRLVPSAVAAGWAAGAALVLLTLLGASATGIGPIFSGNESLNQKALQFRRLAPGACDVLVFGSSNALNNFDTATLGADLRMRAFNAGYWGASPTETPALYDAIVPACRPRLIVVAVAYPDLSSDANDDADWNGLLAYVRQRSLAADVWAYLHRWPQVVAAAVSLRASHFASNLDYESLAFDGSGGVMLACSGFHDIAFRWTEFRQKPVRPAVPAGLAALDAVARRAAESSVRIAFARAPMIVEAERTLATPVAGEFWAAVKGVAEAHGGTWVDGRNDGAYVNTDFADYVHMNACGAARFAHALAARLRDSDASNDDADTWRQKSRVQTAPPKPAVGQ
jgi:hypothetical protein